MHEDYLKRAPSKVDWRNLCCCYRAQFILNTSYNEEGLWSNCQGHVSCPYWFWLYSPCHDSLMGVWVFSWLIIGEKYNSLDAFFWAMESVLAWLFVFFSLFSYDITCLKCSDLCHFSYSKREVNKKVLKVPGIEQKVKISFLFVYSFA